MELLKCIFYLAAIGILSFILGRLLPDTWFREDSWFFQCFDWEKGGRVYNAFHIRKWQNKVPDMSRLFPGIMQEKKISRNFREDLPLMIRETCIAEFIHWVLCIAGLGCLRIWPGFGGFVTAFLYTLGNLPFIMIQRYNRPRLVGLLGRCSGSRKERELCLH